MPNLKTIQLISTVLLLVISSSIFAQVKSNKPSTLMIKDSAKTKSKTQSDSTAIKLKGFLNRKYYDTILSKELPEYLNSLSRINFIKGKIFFTGNGFPQTIVATFYGNLGKDDTFTDFYSRCISGSRIVLEECAFKNKEDTIAQKFNRSIFIR